MNKENTVKISALVKGYYTFPIITAIVLILLAAYLFLFVSQKAGLIVGAFFVVYFIVMVIIIAINNRSLIDNLVDFAREYNDLEGKFVEEFPMPYAITMTDGSIILYNRKFARFADEPAGIVNLTGLFKELDETDLDFDGEEKNISIVYDGRNYRMQIKKMEMDQRIFKNSLFSRAIEQDMVYAVFLFDETEIISMVKKGFDEQLVVGNLYVDSFEEMFDQVSDVKKSLLLALLDREINNYFGKLSGVVRKIEKDKYFVIFKRKYLPGLQRSKFDILDNIKELDTGIDRKLTISMGIGTGPDYDKNMEYSKQGIELALGRGGDQVVVKDGERVYFYGGKTRQVEKNTRVKARIKTLALKEVLMNKDNIVIMGHKTIDPDALGAAIGIYRAATALGKRANILINQMAYVAEPLMGGFKTDEEYVNNGVFINSVKAEEIVDENTALVIVDANKPSVFEDRHLIDKTKTVVIIDHHIQSGEKIDSLVLSYVEPTASSTCEMVSEIIRYIADDVKLKKIEAEVLYAGILIDTNYFSKNTGVRTFEAAAFLRKNGVDVTKVKGMFNNSLEDIKAKAEAVRNAEIISPGFIFASCPSEGLLNPTIVAAQSANELLDIKDIVGSFVATEVGGRVFISARSVGDVNVQLVMERLGGGGHQNMAGSQMDGVTIEEARSRIKNTIIKMRKEGTL